MRVLVAHASAHGSTASIARRIAARLGRAGCVADVRDAATIGALAGYDAVVLGSAVHGGAWLPAAAALPARCAAELAGRPLWLFSVSSVGETSSVFGPRVTRRMRAMRPEPREVAAWRAGLAVAGHRSFAGVVRPADWGRAGDLFVRLCFGRYGDHRDWADVDAWADRIAAGLVGDRALADPPAVADAGPNADALDLYWIPLGAGARVVRRSGRCYEALVARRQHRAPAPLFHSALVATLAGVRTTIEMTPVSDLFGPERRGVVGEGAVGLGWLGRWRLFRYEIRRWEGGEIPDLRYAVGAPVRLSGDPAVIGALLRSVPAVPTPVWGRDELRAGEMWNSNSVIAWLLARAGLLGVAGSPPAGGRAPGWSAGVVVAEAVPSGTARPEPRSPAPAR